ncbi:ABC transporter substrate-binding protein [Hymenobacter sp. NBH84]|uniref:ABC transporter substrate-binding protein n=1 Tax=Hymenobacter sp. NBH84 TaxID=2596915 RepID=UPI00162A0E6D|nr:ABC transporter substrate-binding protein [Hymenobacter sp. NBH84]QNE38894.1 ABC transporter substrate-binding protein [Hymenobacter sp. NBH84]
MRPFSFIRLLCVLGSALALPNVGHAAWGAPLQTPTPATPEQNTRYQNGKLLLDQGSYLLAMKELEPLTPPAARFERAPEAAYLYAVAATRLKKWPEAEQMLNLLRTEYPTSALVPDALYLQVQVSFEQGEPDNALRTLQQLPAGKLKAEREAMEINYLSRLNDRALFQTLLQRYPQNATLGRVYADKLLGGWYTPADKATLARLVEQFKLDPTRYTPRQVGAAKKNSYNIAVLLPFEFTDVAQARRTQFVTDLYAGMRLAQDSLQREGRPVQVFAYDTGADTLQLKRVLALPELASMDLIIGPVYKSGSKILARYAQQKQIITVNPLSQDGELVQNNAWHYLYEPSSATQGQQAARFALNTFTNRTAAILYDNTSDDAAFAQAYKAAYEAQGGKVKLMRRAVGTTTDSVFAQGFVGFDLKSVGHLVVASTGRRAGPYTFKRLQAQKVTMPIITYAAWLDNPSVSLNQLDARDVYMLYPHYLDPGAVGVRRFQQLYAQQYNLPPSVFANMGFEMLYYFAQRLHDAGPAFQQQLSDSGPVSGALFQGIGYPGGAHDNQYVPIVKLERMNVEVQNPVGQQ